jgi:hypothetical protein
MGLPIFTIFRKYELSIVYCILYIDIVYCIYPLIHYVRHEIDS